MLSYESLSDTLIRVKLQPNNWNTRSSATQRLLHDHRTNNKEVIVNYELSSTELDIYIELTRGKENAFEDTGKYRLPSEKWIYCKTDWKIEQCQGFGELELGKQDGNVSYYVVKGSPIRYWPNVKDTNK